MIATDRGFAVLRGRSIRSLHSMESAIMSEKLRWAALCIATLISGTAFAQDEPRAPESLQEKASYLLGRDIIADFNGRLVEVDLEQLIAGIRAASAGKPSMLSAEDSASVMKVFSKDLEERQQRRMRELADKNMREGAAYLKEHALQDGVKQLESGLQYEVVAAGEGDPPKLTDRVKVHFVGKNLAGKVFESTVEQKDPAIVAVGGVGLRGIVDALLRMKPGAKWRIVVPPDLAYGVSGAPPDIEPNQTLVFEIELLEIVK